MPRTMCSRESRMREIRTYGLMRERASLAEPSLLYFDLNLTDILHIPYCFPQPHDYSPRFI